MRQFLGLQSPGRVDFEPGVMTLVNPAIVLYRDSQPAVLYYWIDKQFTTRSYFIDD